jgi:hypothetical protein
MILISEASGAIACPGVWIKIQVKQSKISRHILYCLKNQGGSQVKICLYLSERGHRINANYEECKMIRKGTRNDSSGFPVRPGAFSHCLPYVWQHCGTEIKARAQFLYCK